MLRPRPAPLAALLAAALVLAARPHPARAASLSGSSDSSPTYQLFNIGTAPVSKVIFSVVPPGSIPDQSQSSPLTILDGSAGFDRSSLIVAVGNGTVPAGQPNAGSPLQDLGLDFGPKGFAPGGVLDFKLSLDPSSTQSPSLGVLSPTSGLKVVNPTPASSGGSTSTSTPPPSTGGETPTPEPLTLLIWSTGALGVGVARARAYRLGRRAAD